MAARPGDSPSVAACRSALACWSRAEARANRQREALEEWDPAAAERLNPEAWRRRLLAADPAGDLLRARRLARQAWVLASTPGERWSAACLEAYLAYDADDRPAQLRVARRLTALRPGSREALLANLRARAGRRASASLAAWGGARGSLSRG